MSDQKKNPPVEEVLSRLENIRQDLVKMLHERQKKSAIHTVEAEEFVLRDAAGWTRAKLGVEGASPQLNLVDREGQTRASLGLREDGTPYLDLLDLEGNASNIIPGAPPAPEAEEVAPASEAPVAPLPQRGWGQKFFNVAVLLLLAVTLGGLLVLTTRIQWDSRQLSTEMLTIHGQDGSPRAQLQEKDGRISLSLLDKAGKARLQLSVDESGEASLDFLDRMQEKQAELKVGAGGEPVLRAVKKDALSAKPGEQSQAPAPPAPESLAEKGALTVPPAPKEPAPAPAVKYVGSVTSNKYHLPTCKWAKRIRPERLVTFASVAEARAKGYIPCPACKPPARD